MSMSSDSIDRRLVEMQFDNAQFEKGIKQSTESLEQLKKSLDLDDAARGMERLERVGHNFAFDGVASAVDAISGKFSAMEVVAISALNRITNQAMAAGEKMIKSLSVDQVKTGFDKYADKTKAVNTIMNATDMSAKEVGDYMDKLAWFTDETSYNFTDMANNIGKFTSAGVDLDQAVTAMFGIATEAAISGQGIAAASRAMYNLSQAIGMGKVRLTDWMSIENANMGTKEFKETIIDTAIAMGKLNKEGKTAKGTQVTFKNFRDTLSEDWFTSDVLIESLKQYGQYAEEIFKYVEEHGGTAAEAMEALGDMGMDLGKRAFEAAQVARTFKESVDATTDAVSSGWMAMFEQIFGNVEESAELWTDVTNALWEVFASGFEGRVDLLKEWKELGGRTDLLEGLYSAFEALWNIVTTVREAIADVFPPLTAERLEQLTEGVKNFGNQLKKTFGIEDVVVGQQMQELTETVPNFTEAFDQELKRGANGEGVRTMQKRLIELGYDLGSTGADGIFGPKTEAALQKFQKEAKLTVDGVYNEASHKSLLETLFGTHEVTTSGELVDVTEQRLSPALEKIQAIATGAASALKLVGMALNFVGQVAGFVGELLAPVGEAILDVFVAGAQSVTGFVDGVEDLNVFENALTVIKTTLEPLRRVFELVGDAIRIFFGIADEGTDKQAVFDELGTSLENIGKSIWNWFSNLGPVSKAIADFLSGIWTSVSGYLGGEDGLFSRIGKWLFGDEKSEDLDARVGKLQKLKEKVLSIWASIKTFLFGTEGTEDAPDSGTPGFFTNVFQFFKGIWDSATALLEGVDLAEVFDKIAKWTEPIRKFFSGVWSSIVGWFTKSTAGQGELDAYAIGQSIFGGIANFITNISTFIGTFLGNINTENVLKFVASVVNKVKDFIIKLWDYVGYIYTAISGGTKKKSGLPAGKERHSKKESQKDAEAASSPFESIGKTLQSVFSAVQTLLPFIGLGSLAVLVVVGVIKIIKTISGLLHSYAEAKGNIPEPQKKDSFGDTMLKLAESLAIVGAVIFIIGKFMSPEELKQGAITLGGIAVGLLLMMTAMVGLNKLNKTGGKGDLEKLGQSVRDMAIAIAIIGAAIWVLGNADPTKMMTGATYIGAVALAMLAFMGALKLMRVQKLDLKGLIQLSVAIGILGLLVNLLGKMDKNRLKRGVIAVGSLALILSLAIGLATSFGKAKKIKVAGFLALAMGIGILAIAVSALGKQDPAVLWKGVGVVTALSAIMTIMMAVLSSVNSKQNFSAGGFLLVGAVIAALSWVLSLIVKSIQGVDPGVIWSFTALLDSVLAAIIVIGVLVGKGVVSNNDLYSGALGIGGALAIIALIATAVVGGLGVVNDALAGKGVEYINQGGEVLAALADALTPFQSDLANALVPVALLVGSEILGKIPGGVGAAILGAFGITTALSVMTVIATAVVGGLGKLDMDYLEGEGVGYIRRGGDVLEALADALTPFKSDLANALTPVAALTGSAIIGLIPGGPVGVILGALGIGGAFAALVIITTATVGGLGKLDAALNGNVIASITNGGEVLSALGGALASFGTGFQNVMNDQYKSYADAMGYVATKLAEYGTVDENGNTQIDTMFENAKRLSDKMDEYFSQKDAYAFTEHPEVEGYATAASQLSSDMVRFSEGIVAIADAINSLSSDKKAVIKQSQVNHAIKMASLVDSFFSGLQPYTTYTNPDSFGENSYFTAPEQLSGDMTLFGNALSTFSTSIQGLGGDESTLDADIAAGLGAAGKVAGFFTDLSTESGKINGTPIKTYHDNVIEVSGSMGLVSTAISTFATNVNGIRDAGLEADTDTAVTVLKKVAGFLAQIPDMNIERSPGWIDQLFGYGSTKTDTLFTKVAELGPSMKSVRGGISGLAEEGSTFANDFESALGALSQMATFMESLNGRTFPKDTPPFIAWLTGNDNPAAQVIDKVALLGEKLKGETLGTAVKGLASGTFLEDFTTAINAMQRIATFMHSLGVVDDISGTFVNPTGTSTFQDIVDGINSMIGAFGSLATGDVDISGITSIADTFSSVTSSVAELKNTINPANMAIMTNDVNMSLTTIGSDLPGRIAAGVKDSSSIQTALQTVITTAAGAVDTSESEDVGAMVDAGLARGINNNADVVLSAMTALMENVISAAQVTIDMHSPSKVFARIGKFIDLGLVKGISGNDSEVIGSMEDLMSKLTNSTNPLLDKLGTVVTEDMDMSPTISPVLDLDQYNKTLSSMKQLDDGTWSNVADDAGITSSGQKSSYNPNDPKVAALRAESRYMLNRSKLQDLERKYNSVMANNPNNTNYIEELLEKISNLKVILDTGATVGNLGPSIDKYLGKQQDYAGRRV